MYNPKGQDVGDGMTKGLNHTPEEQAFSDVLPINIFSKTHKLRQDCTTRVPIFGRGREFSLRHGVQTCFGSYPMDTGGSFPGDKAAGA
jgi:hypothetical protein